MSEFSRVFGGVLQRLLFASAMAFAFLGGDNAMAAKLASQVTMTAMAVPSAAGQTLMMVAQVTPVTATGAVTFKANGQTVGSAVLVQGNGSVTGVSLAAGSYVLTATYSGDAWVDGSTSANFVLSTKLASTTTLTSSANPSTPGQTVTLKAGVVSTVAGAQPTGSVSFYDGISLLGSGLISAGSASLAVKFDAVGNRALMASYLGDTNFGASNGQLVQAVGSSLANPSVQVSVAQTSIVLGQSATLTAKVTPASATGAVVFLDGATSLGVVTLASGTASFTWTPSTTGAHTISATYGGNTNLAPATAPAVALQVNAASGPPSAVGSPPTVKDFEYDAEGRATRATLASASLKLATLNSYDALGRQATTTDPRQGTTRMTYDGGDRLVQLTDPRALVTSSPRNGLGDVTQLVSPDTGTRNSTYDAAGHLLSSTDSRGVLATYVYDNLGRQRSVTYSQSGQASLAFGATYDETGAGFTNGVGRLTSTSHPSGGTQYAYDAQGRVVRDVQRVDAASGANTLPIVRTVGYAYDAAGHVTSITYPSGRVVTIAYQSGRPSSIGLAKDAASAATPLVTAMRFAPFGGLAGWSLQMNTGPLAQTRSFDSSGRPLRYPLGNFVRDLAYDAAGRITSYTHYDATAAVAATAQAKALDQSFAYDELGRLTNVTTATGSLGFAYDANGNRTSAVIGGVQSVYGVAASSNRLLSVSNPARNFTYDAAGNTTVDSRGYTATYNLAGRLATTTVGGLTASYSYDGFGRRVRKALNTGAASTVVFAYDLAGHLLGEYDGSGNTLREYVWLGDTPLAVFTPDPVASANAPLVYFIQTDHLGTPRMVLDKNNALRWRWLGEPFGSAAAETNPAGMGVFAFNLRLPGQYFDVETGLNYNWNRYYDVTLGRYVQSDPIGLQGGINTYTYVGGDPLSDVDPNGLNPIAGAIAGAELGTIVFPGLGTIVGAAVGTLGGYLVADQLSTLIFAKPGNESRPGNAPPGTIPIDQTGLGRSDVHDIKDGIGAGARDWTGVAPNGDVISSDPSGNAVNHGPVDQFTHRPTGLCPRR